eukprot:scaffold126037_cov14-Tisochrysis_lutea.AAC.2
MFGPTSFFAVATVITTIITNSNSIIAIINIIMSSSILLRQRRAKSHILFPSQAGSRSGSASLFQTIFWIQ